MVDSVNCDTLVVVVWLLNCNCMTVKHSRGSRRAVRASGVGRVWCCVCVLSTASTASSSESDTSSDEGGKHTVCSHYCFDEFLLFAELLSNLSMAAAQ